MTVIVVTQEIGSRGDEVAAGIAKGLDLEFVHQERLELCVAERMRTDEGTVHRLVAGNASLLERCKINRRPLLRCMAEEIVKLAARGNVLVEGQWAAALLRPVSHVICVHLCVPVRPRARALTKLPALGQADLACQVCQRSNAAGAYFQRWLFGSNCEGPAYSDLVLNTVRISLAECVEQVRCLAQSARFQATEESLTMLANLRSLLATDMRGEVEVGFHKVRLTGVTSSEQAIAKIEEHLHGKGTCRVIATQGASLPPSQWMP